MLEQFTLGVVVADAGHGQGVVRVGIADAERRREQEGGVAEAVIGIDVRIDRDVDRLVEPFGEDLGGGGGLEQSRHEEQAVEKTRHFHGVRGVEWEALTASRLMAISRLRSVAA